MRFIALIFHTQFRALTSEVFASPASGAWKLAGHKKLRVSVVVRILRKYVTRSREDIFSMFVRVRDNYTVISLKTV